MKRTWTEDDCRILASCYPTAYIPDLAVQLGRTVKAVIGKAKECKLRRSKDLLVWSPARLKKLREIYAEKTNAEIAAILGVSECSVGGAAFKYKLRKSATFKWKHSSKGFFLKGHVPDNKGKEQTDFMCEESIERTKATRFRKGHTPCNHKPVGYERIDKYGYVEIKTAEPNFFEFKHRVVWKQHNGEIPDRHKIRFKDGNKLNLCIENLYMVSNAEHMIENTIQRYPVEVKRAIRKVGKFNKIIKEYEKR
ncbi:hypothetical protein EZS27_001386 [termite gut metagenome]|uniref:HNH nuclease domain-containing protein n=1 Tax=termite gut metagenome TaxID=433724 RepID=A0A5J4T167_9ZZZZ